MPGTKVPLTSSRLPATYEVGVSETRPLEIWRKSDDGTGFVLTNSEAPVKEQRRLRRYAVNFPCEIKPAKQAGKKVSTLTQDLSGGGLYFFVPAKWKVGTPIEFVLHLPLQATGRLPGAVRCEGKVARVVEQEGQRFGIGATIERYEFIHTDRPKSHGDKLKTALLRALRWSGVHLGSLRLLD